MISKIDGWPAAKIERRKAVALKPSPTNARTHSPEQIEQIAASIREWGWTQPILIDEDEGVIAGHGRLAAAKLLGVAEVPVIVARGWSEEQKRAYVLADNQLALNAGWDTDLLRVELGFLGDSGFDTGLIGFGEEFLADLLTPRSTGLTGPDEAPPLPAEPVTRPGDLWVCGTHRVLCGDSTNREAVDRLLTGVKPHLMVTDPPYGVAYDPTWRHRAGVNRSSRVGKVQNDERADWAEAWALFPGNIAYVWHGALHAVTVADSLIRQGFTIRSQIIWAKERLVIGRGDYHWQHEPCWYAVRGKGNWKGDRKQTTLWSIAGREQDAETVHGTQKPVECMRRPIVNNSSPGQAVYDPFCGSGTTMIAAEMEGRHAYCMELSEAYCDVIVTRWQAFTGKAAVLDGDGLTFDEIKGMRDAA